ncbi:MAG: TlpA disulfide reductase family protein [Betaproteobacteria bacterium]|jgi:thiol-disulfide isomerase/thioredoxin
MRKQIVAVALGIALSVSALAIEVGQSAPEIQLPGRSGAIKLSELKGKAVYLDFWASWCGPCKQSFPWMNEMQAKYGAKGLQVLAVNLDQKPEDATGFLQQTKVDFLIAMDPVGQSAQKYNVKGMPSSLLIGRDGKVTVVHTGFNAASKAELERAIVAALEAGK